MQLKHSFLILCNDKHHYVVPSTAGLGLTGFDCDLQTVGLDFPWLSCKDTPF